MSEIWEIHKSVTKQLKHKPNDYKIEYQREVPVNLLEDEKWQKPEICDNILELVYQELMKIKGKNEEDKGEKKEDENEEKQKFRISTSLKKTQSKVIDENLPYEDEIIEEDIFKVKKRRKYLKEGEVVKEEIIEEQKMKECVEKLNEIPKETIEKEAPPLEHVIIDEHKEDDNHPEKLDNEIKQLSKPKQKQTENEINNEQQVQDNNVAKNEELNKGNEIKSSNAQNEIIDNNNPSLPLNESDAPSSTQVKTLKTFFEEKDEKQRSEKRKRTYLQKPSRELDINVQAKLTPVPQNVPLTQVPTEFLEPLDWNLYSYEKEIDATNNDPIFSLCYCPTLNNGNPSIVTGHNSGNIYAWDIENCKKIKTYSEHKGKVCDLKKIFFTSQLRQIFASISEDTFLKIWDSSSSSKSAISIQYKIPLVLLDIHPSNYIIFADKEKTLYCQKVDFGRKGELIKEDRFKGATTHANEINSMRILDQGSIHNTYLVTGSENVMQIHKVDFIRRKFILHQEYPEAHQGVINDILDITNMQFLTCASDRLIKVWDITKEAPIRVIDSVCNENVYSLMNVYVADAFVCGTADNKMKIVNKKKILSREESDYKPTILYEYDRKEPLYKMIYLKDNDLYSIASINNGCSTKVYMWGNNTKQKPKEK